MTLGLPAADAPGVRSSGPTSDPPQIGRYQVIRHLATGGMAQIYLARMDGMASFERHVVLKTILANRANDRRFINMFLDEAKLAATLNHQNIAQVYEVDQADGAYYMAMEYVHGENCRAILETSIRRATIIPIELAVLIVSGAAAGLHHAHERKGKSGQALNIVHRDVSPANIMVGYDGSVKVLDFGIAKAEERYTQTIGSTIKGKYGYMSPEQCKGKPIDRRSDIFALGIVLYELTTQRRAFKGRDDFDTMKRIVAGDLVLPSSLVPNYPSELEGIILKALSSEAEDRYSTAQDMIEALDVFTQRAKLACTNTAMARFMVHLFGEPREPWETQDGRQSSSQPSLATPVHGSRPIAPLVDEGSESGDDGNEEAATTVAATHLPGATLPPSSAMVPPRTITTPMHRVRGSSPTASAIVRTRANSVSGRMTPPPAGTPTGNPPYATGSMPPPSRSGNSTTPPPMRSAGATTPPPMRSGGSTTPPPMRSNAPTTPPPRRARSATNGPGPGDASGQFPSPLAAGPMSPLGSIPPSRAGSAAGSYDGRDPWNQGDGGSGVRGADGREVPLGYPTGPDGAALVPGELPVRGRTPTPSVPMAPMFPPGKGPTPSQIAAARAAPLMRPTPSAPLSVPLVPRTYTPAALPPPPLGPLMQRHSMTIGTATVDSSTHHRAASEDGSLRAQSSVMAALPRPADSSVMAPLPRPETMGPQDGDQRFKYRWAIVLVLLVVLAAVGLMIGIALTSSPS